MYCYCRHLRVHEASACENLMLRIRNMCYEWKHVPPPRRYSIDDPEVRWSVRPISSRGVADCIKPRTPAALSELRRFYSAAGYIGEVIAEPLYSLRCAISAATSERRPNNVFHHCNQPPLRRCPVTWGTPHPSPRPESCALSCMLLFRNTCYLNVTLSLRSASAATEQTMLQQLLIKSSAHGMRSAQQRVPARR